MLNGRQIRRSLEGGYDRASSWEGDGSESNLKAVCDDFTKSHLSHHPSRSVTQFSLTWRRTSNLSHHVSIPIGIVDVSRPLRLIIAFYNPSPFDFVLPPSHHSKPSHRTQQWYQFYIPKITRPDQTTTPPCRVARMKRPATCRQQAVAGFLVFSPNSVCLPSQTPTLKSIKETLEPWELCAQMHRDRGGKRRDEMIDRGISYIGQLVQLDHLLLDLGLVVVSDGRIGIRIRPGRSRLRVRGRGSLLDHRWL